MKYIFYTTIFFLIGFQNLRAQNRTTKEAKVIMVVNAEINQVTHMELFTENVSLNFLKKGLLKKYPNSKFYLGLLKGTYKITDDGILPVLNATITMYTNKRLFSEEQLFSSKKYTIGDEFKLGKATTKVVSNKKEELIVKTVQ